MKRILSFFAILAIICFVPPVPTSAQPPTARTKSVYNVLDHMGQVVYNGNVPNIGEVIVLWQAENPTVFKNGLPVINQHVEFLDNQVVVYGIIPATENSAQEEVRATFRVSESGYLTIEFSDWAGYNGNTMSVSFDGGLVSFTSCNCYGGTGKKIKKRKCTTAECADAGVNCNTNVNGPAVYCENREPMPVPQIGPAVDLIPLSP